MVENNESRVGIVKIKGQFYILSFSLCFNMLFLRSKHSCRLELELLKEVKQLGSSLDMIQVSQLAWGLSMYKSAFRGWSSNPYPTDRKSVV